MHGYDAGAWIYSGYIRAGFTAYGCSAKKKEGVYHLDKCRLYTEKEDEYIRQHYATTPHRVIASELGRTVRSIRHRSEKIGCARKKPLRRWCEEEDKTILASKGRPLADVAKELGRNQSDVLKRAHRLGFVSWRRPDGGLYIDSRGYKVLGFEKGMPIYEHRTIVENLIGRKLTADERVHHIDTNKRNNDPKNLFLFGSAAEHIRAHHTLDKLVGENANVPELLRMGVIVFDKDKGEYLCGTQVQ